MGGTSVPVGTGVAVSSGVGVDMSEGIKVGVAVSNPPGMVAVAVGDRVAVGVLVAAADCDVIGPLNWLMNILTSTIRFAMVFMTYPPKSILTFLFFWSGGN